MNVEAIKKALEGVTPEEAIDFINTAMRNWNRLPRLDADDLRDLAEELQRFSERRYASTLESLQRENEELRKDRYDLAYAITGGEDAPGLLDTVPTTELVEIARNTHRSHSADIDRAEAAEAEVKRLREVLKPFAEASAWNAEGVDLTQGDRPAFPSDIDLMNLEGNSLTLCDLFDARDALASPVRYEPEPASSFVGKSPFEFDRYINGALMAEGVRIEKVETLEKAMVIAAKVASRGPNGEVPVLIMRARTALASTGGEHHAE